MEKKRMTSSLKEVRAMVPHCDACKERIGGEGHPVTPFYCSCGIWKWDNDAKHYYTEK